MARAHLIGVSPPEELSCAKEQTQMLKPSVVIDFCNWISDPSFLAGVVSFEICPVDSFIPLLAQQITVMTLFQFPCHTPLLVRDMAAMF